MPKKHHQGFIPLIGLITTAFLAVAVFIGTAIVSNKNTNLDLRGLANTQRADGQCLGPGESCTSGKSYFDNICTPTDERCGTKTVTTNPTTPTKIADGQCLGPGESCSSGKSYTDNSCTPTDERCGVKQEVETVLVDNGDCAPNNTTTKQYKCQNDKGYADTTCGGRNYRCGTKTSSKADGQCLGPGESRSSGKSYTDNSCTSTDERCGDKPVITTVSVANGACLGLATGIQYVCQSGIGYGDSTCGGRNYRCGTKTSSKADGQCLGPGESCSSGKSYTDNSCTPTDERCGDKPVITTVSVANGACLGLATGIQYVCQSGIGYGDSTCGGRNYRCGTKTSSKADGQCLGPGESCSSGKSYTDNSCTPTDERCGVKQEVETVLIDNGDCAPNNTTTKQYKCQNDKGYADTTCGGRNYRCGTKTSSKADGQCLGPGESCSSGKSYTDNSCTPTDERCGVKQEVETVLVDNGDCAPNNTTTKQYKCQNDKGYADTTCGGRNYRCGTKTSSKADGQCLGPGESCSSGKSYTDK